jgi:hypothetical protein
LFEGYTDTMNLRIFEVRNKETNEEFKSVNVFRYSMTGIINKLDDPTGKKPILQYDDDVSGLVGKRINVFAYKNKDGYSKFFDTIAPVEQKGEHYSPSIIQLAGEKSVFIFQLRLDASECPPHPNLGSQLLRDCDLPCRTQEAFAPLLHV